MRKVRLALGFFAIIIPTSMLASMVYIHLEEAAPPQYIHTYVGIVINIKVDMKNVDFSDVTSTMTFADGQILQFQCVVFNVSPGYTYKVVWIEKDGHRQLLEVRKVD